MRVLLIVCFVTCGCGARTGLDVELEDAGSILDATHAKDVGTLADVVFPDVVIPPTPPLVCTPPDDACLLTCPFGTICVKEKFGSNPPQDLGCTPIPAGCNGIPTCECMTCVCPKNLPIGTDKCVSGTDGEDGQPYLQCDVSVFSDGG
jgi:hypothetical protein